MVSGDEAMQVQLLEETRAMCSKTNFLLLLGHGGLESGGLKMEVHSRCNYYEVLCKILMNDKKSHFDNGQNIEYSQEYLGQLSN